MVVVAVLLVVDPQQKGVFPSLASETASITSAVKLSPNWISCGFSSEQWAKSGSTMLTAGSRPAAASAKNFSMWRRCPIVLATPKGYMFAVHRMSPLMR